MTAYVAGDGSLTTVRRDASGLRVMRKETAEWASFHRAADVTPAVRSALRDSRFVSGIRDEGATVDQGWVRVLWADPRVRARSCAADGWFAARGVPTFEADVDPVRRWLTDGTMGVARPRRVYLDLEADSRLATTRKEAARMLAWSLYDPEAPEGQRSRYEVLVEDTDAAERRLIAKLWEALEAYDQVCAWAGDWFDFPYLDARTARRGLRPERRNWLWLDHLVLYRRMNSSAAESGDEKQSMALDAVARSLGLRGKLEDVDRAKSWDEWLADPDRLGRYCARDSEVMAEIEAATGYVELLQTLAEATFVFPDSRAIGPKLQVESFMLRLGRERGVRFPTHHYREEDEDEEEGQFKGAFVMEPAKGILRDVHVCDFARLYPSIILSWNVSPETWRDDVVLRETAANRPVYISHLPLQVFPRPDGVAEVPLVDRCFAQEPQGLLPIAIAEMLRLRKFWDERKRAATPGTPEWVDADRRSAAYKVAANSFYGVVGSRYSRFFVREVAESVSQGGVWLLQQTISAIEALGLVVTYADTDSAFVAMSSHDAAPPEVLAKWVARFGPGDSARSCAAFDSYVARFNEELYPRLLREKGAARNHVSLAYEKAFRKVVFVGKKRYAAAYLHYKGSPATEDSKPEIKGLEYKRGDTVHLARELQREVVYRILGYRVEESDDPADFEALVEAYKARVLSGKLPLEEVVLAKKLTKGVTQYARKRLKDGGGYAAQAAHVEVARVLLARGEDVGKGRRVEYVVVDGSVSPAVCVPASDFDGAYDAFWLWESAVWPPTQRLLEAAFPGYGWAKHDRVRPVRVSPRQLAARVQGNLFG